MPENLHPTYNEMIQTAVRTINRRGGTSRQAISKFIMSSFQVGDNEHMVNSHIRQALKRLVASEKLVQVTGKGMNGSYKLVSTKKTGKKTSQDIAKITKTAAKTADALFEDKENDSDVDFSAPVDVTPKKKKSQKKVNKDKNQSPIKKKGAKKQVKA